MISPTIISTEDQIYLANSPINFRVYNLAKDNSLQTARVDLYIWSGDLDTPPSEPSYKLNGLKVSNQDNYINFQISELVLAEINNTRFVWNSGANAPMVRGEGVFFQMEYKVDAEAMQQGLTNFATAGYRYDFEQVGDIAGSLDKQPYLGLIPINYDRNYDCNIKYLKREFDLTLSLGTCTSENIIKSTAYTPTNSAKPWGYKYLIVYLNRHGLFDYFTPFGKVTKSIKIDADTTAKLYRNPKAINTSVMHSKKRGINQSEQSISINTGYLTEGMVEQVEEIIYSPLVYLISFSGAVYTTEQIGITVDSTIITVDSTLYTVDNTTITSNDVNYYSDYKQLAVTNENNDLEIKTRLNDKGKINYDLKFNITTDRINNVR